LRKADVIVRKIIKQGTSQGVTLPKKWLEEMGLEIGDAVILKKNEKIILEDLPTYEEVHKEIKEFEKTLEAEAKT